MTRLPPALHAGDANTDVSALSEPRMTSPGPKPSMRAYASLRSLGTIATSATDCTYHGLTILPSHCRGAERHRLSITRIRTTSWGRLLITAR